MSSPDINKHLESELSHFRIVLQKINFPMSVTLDILHELLTTLSGKVLCHSLQAVVHEVYSSSEEAFESICNSGKPEAYS